MGACPYLAKSLKLFHNHSYDIDLFQGKVKFGQKCLLLWYQAHMSCERIQVQNTGPLVLWFLIMFDYVQLVFLMRTEQPT